MRQVKVPDNLNKGVQAYKNSKFPEAVTFFQTAVQLEPPTRNPSVSGDRIHEPVHSRRGIAGKRPHGRERLQGIPGSLTLDPKDETAAAYIAKLYFDQKKLDQAAEGTEADRRQSAKQGSLLHLGVIAWTQWLLPDREARNKMNMKPEDPGPLKDKKVRDELRAKWRPILDEGVANAQKALDIDKEYDDAMAYMNLLVRYRADLDETTEEYKKDNDEADAWVQKTLATKKMKAERKPVAGGITTDSK
jgi:tetratricopeptide (TPR) repeat protein